MQVQNVASVQNCQLKKEFKKQIFDLLRISVLVNYLVKLNNVFGL